MKEQKLKKILAYSGSSFILVFCLFPCIWMLVVSLCTAPDLLSVHSSFVFTLRNYQEVILNRSLHFVDYLRNSVIVSTVVALAVTIFGGLCAYAITRLRFPGRIFIPVGILALSMFPQISVVGYLFRLMTRLGWINTYRALVFPYIALGLPLALWIMLSYFKQVPAELDKAALVDGATRFQVLWKVVFPVAAPGAFSTALLIFILSFNEFLFALMLTVDCKARTIPVGIALFTGLHGQIPWGHIMAAAAVASIPLVLLAGLFQRRIVEGLTQGAVKG